MATVKDPTAPIRLEAGRFAGVDRGTACTQSSFKVGKKAFLYIGPQGGRFKAMLKLKGSIAEATRLAAKTPDRFEVSSMGWVTARFSEDEPLPKKLWKKWLDESYELAGAKPGAKKPTKKKTAKKKATGKKR
ncbi:MAG: MmcQ/YjbR family DNA-binding protein [bacterium]|nr:MmcQ/YjbR family DNA-binding protein [bacterium]